MTAGPDRKQVGCTVDKELWKQLRAQALQEDRSTGKVLDEAIKLYLERVEAEEPQKGQEKTRVSD